MTLTSAEIMQLVNAWLWPFFRIAAVMTAAPVFANRAVPVRVRLGLAVGLTMVIVPLIPDMPSVEPVSMQGLAIALQQVLIGLALGFSVRLVYAALEVAGQQIATLMGLGFASLVDPQNGIEVPVVSHFYILLTTLVFLGLNGHLVMVRILAESFTALPVGPTGLSPESFFMIAERMGWLLSAALLIALPAMAALLIVNLGYGVMSRAAPQLNIFVVGFPITLAFGFTVMLLTLPGMIALVDRLIEQTLHASYLLIVGAP
jgi:flagellar biosynthetic protein FliR